jgi:hypothetical protein
MLEPEVLAGMVLMACAQSPRSRIIEVQMRTMAGAWPESCRIALQIDGRRFHIDKKNGLVNQYQHI